MLVATIFAASAASAVAGGPSAIGQASNGTSYVGFADSPTIQRIDVNGAALPAWTSQTNPVVAISVDPADDVWILSPSSVARYSPTGTYLSGFSLNTCAGNGNYPKDANRYGGLVVTSTSVFVGLNCSPVLERFDRDGGGFVSTTLPDVPRGVAFGPAQNGKPNQVYVALPDAHQVLTFDADAFASGAAPSHALAPATPGGGSTPVPTGIGVDKYGQLVVTDAANHSVYFYDTNNDDSLYRTLGHGPGPGSALGSLNTPTALALHFQDGSALANQLFLADYGNARVQRWDSGGYTFWAADAATPATGGPGPVVTAPVNTTAPAISGTASPGQTLSCQPGTWTGSPTFAFAWKRDSTSVGSGQTYLVTAADAGHPITCAVTATNSAGTGNASSASVTPSPPAPATCNGPVGASINGADGYTNDADVTVTVHAPAGASQVLLSNDGGFTTAVAKPLVGTCKYAFTLKASGSERLPKTVYVRFVGSGFDNNLTLSDDIILDQTAPTTSAATIARSSSARGVTASLAASKKKGRYTLRVTAKDKLSGVKRLQVAPTKSAKRASTVTYKRAIVLKSASKAKWVRVFDRAGNASRWRAVKVVKHRR